MAEAANQAAAQQAPELTGSEAAYRHFEPEARALAADKVHPMRADPMLALQNVKKGVPAVLAYKELLSRTPQVNLAWLESLEGLALATVHAAGLAEREGGGSTGEIQSLLSRNAPLRELLLKSAEACALAGIGDAKKVEAIRKGQGPLDAANDTAALVTLFHDNQKLYENRTPVTVDHLREAALVSTRLLELVKPRGTKSDPAAPSDATDVRDRLWTMLVERHAELRRVAHFLFGEKVVDEKVPLLQSREVHREPKAPPATPTTA